LGRGHLHMLHTETWSRVGGKQLRGTVSIAVLGTRYLRRVRALLAPLDNGSRLPCSATVMAKIPLVGGQIQSLMRGRLAEGIMDIQPFTTACISENG
jgi:hypothetical protein